MSTPVTSSDLVEIADQVPRARSYAASKPDNAWASRYVYDVPRLVATVERLQAEKRGLQVGIRQLQAELAAWKQSAAAG